MSRYKAVVAEAPRFRLGLRIRRVKLLLCPVTLPATLFDNLVMNPLTGLCAGRNFHPERNPMKVIDFDMRIHDVGTIVYEDDERIVTHYNADDIAQILTSITLVKAKVIVSRINRKLIHDNRRLHVCRYGSACSDQTGRYYVMDTVLNALVTPHVDLGAYARELGVLRDKERISED